MTKTDLKNKGNHSDCHIKAKEYIYNDLCSKETTLKWWTDIFWKRGTLLGSGRKKTLKWRRKRRERWTKTTISDPRRMPKQSLRNLRTKASWWNLYCMWLIRFLPGISQCALSLCSSADFSLNCMKTAWWLTAFWKYWKLIVSVAVRERRRMDWDTWWRVRLKVSSMSDDLNTPSIVQW